MLNYGIDPVRYRRDIHEILYKTYEGLLETEKLRPYPVLGEWIPRKAWQTAYWFKAAVHRHLFRKYSYLSAAAYEEPHLDALTQYYRAFEGYPRRSLHYLRAARDFEVAIIPAAEPEYNYREGRLTGKPALIDAALRGFDPLWERDMIADSFEEIARRRDSFAAELYRLNPGALRQRGIGLPVLLRFNYGDAARPPPLSRRVEGMLKKAGLRGVTADSGDAANRGVTADDAGEPRFVLTLSFEELNSDNSGGKPMAVYCELFDRDRGTATLSRDILLPSSSRRDCAALARELADAVFGGN
jgi:hypothetical protein